MTGLMPLVPQQYAPGDAKPANLGMLKPEVIVLGTVVEASKQSPRLGRHHGQLVVRAGELAHRVQVPERHDRDELDFGRELAAEKLDAKEALNPAIGDSDEDLLAEQGLVRIRVLE